MDRRNFFKIVSTVSAGAASVACSNEKTNDLIPLLVADHEIVPGEEQWHPAVCSACNAGCGTIVRVMRGERVIERDGRQFREPVATIKKIEGNPLDSVSGGRLCARGQAELQSLYNPDRVRGPMRRTGARGKGEFTSITWDEAIDTVSAKLAKVHAADPGRILFLTRPQTSLRSSAIHNFLQSLGAPVAASCAIGDLALERKAAELVFGWKGLPRYDIANARYVLGVGADFLGGWASPVFYARQYGHFRQGRPGLRGKLVQAESRMSITAASADEWLPVRPGFEPHLLIAISRILLDDKLVRNVDAEIAEPILAADLAGLMQASGIPEKRLRRVAHELGESEAPLVIAGASIPQTNSLDALIASHHLNILLGSPGKAGGVLPPNATPASPRSADMAEALKGVQFLILDGENPVYTYPQASGVAGSLAAIETIVSFGNFIDDSVAYADLILPDHHSLESEDAVMAPVSTTSIAVAVNEPFVRPLHNTMSIQQTLGGIAKKMNLPFAAVTAQSLIQPLLSDGETWPAVALQGGLWREGIEPNSVSTPPAIKPAWNAAAFSGNADQFPLHFQPYHSIQYGDGRGANLPWMQEMPDPVSSSMWGLPVEIDPKAAAELKVSTGDWVRVESTHGSLDAQAYIHPAALPGVVSMAIGEGHTTYGRYASHRGANPLSILAPMNEPATNTLAFGATRVKITRLEKKPADLIQFAPQDREQGPWGYR